MPDKPTRSAKVEIRPGPFVGHRQILDQLCEAVEQTRLGHGARFWISGPHGIGKSRMLAEIARYAALRNVPFHAIASQRALNSISSDVCVCAVDPLDRLRLAEWAASLRAAADRGSLCLATTTSASRCRAFGVPAAEIVALAGLEVEDALRLLRAWLGPAVDAEWARRTVIETRGNPGRMWRAAERRLNRSAAERARSASRSGHV